MCSSCNKSSTKQSSSPQSLAKAKKAPTPVSDCSFSLGVLRVWYDVLKCVKSSGNLNKISLSTQQANSYLGYIQSAINYTDDYCYFSDQLTDFQTNILPRIIENVPTCI